MDKEFSFKYGDGTIDFTYPEEDIQDIVFPNKVELPEGTEEDIIRNAIEHPIGCEPLEKIISPEDTVCLLVPDTTRQWGRPKEVIDVLVHKLWDIGVKDENMLIISATGTHKKQTKEEHITIVGEEIYNRIKVVDHDCDTNLKKIGTSSRGNDIYVNKTATEYDKRIIVGATVFHFLAGFGGGRKYVLPGISGRSTIMSNHSQYFAPGGVGSGKNDLVDPGLYDNNPISKEMYEAADMLGIDFNITSVIGSNKQIAFCYAGELHKSHKAATEKCREVDGATVTRPAEMVVACGCGYPKDINLYQTMSKTITNSMGVLEKDPNSVLVVVAECRDGIGNEDTVRLLQEMDNARDREIYTREHYTIGLNIAYMLTALAEEFHMIVVSTIDPEIFSKSKIHGVHTIEEAFALAKKLTGKEHLRTTMMPYASSTCTTVQPE